MKTIRQFVIAMIFGGCMVLGLHFTYCYAGFIKEKASLWWQFAAVILAAGSFANGLHYLKKYLND